MSFGDDDDDRSKKLQKLQQVASRKIQDQIRDTIASRKSAAGGSVTKHPEDSDGRRGLVLGLRDDYY